LYEEILLRAVYTNLKTLLGAIMRQREVKVFKDTVFSCVRYHDYEDPNREDQIKVYDDVPITYCVSFKRITDTSGYGKFNFCKHDVIEATVHTDGGHTVALEQREDPIPYTRSYGYTFWPWPNEFNPNMEACMSYVGCPDVNDRISRGIAAIIPTMETGIALDVFVLELAEFKQMFQLVDLTKSIGRNVANGILNLSFGAIPFINDVEKIFNTLRDFKSQLELFKLHNGRRNIRHYAEPFSVGGIDTTETAGTTFLYPPQTDLRRFQVLPTQGLFNLTVDYTWRIDTEDWLFKTKAYLDAFGVYFDYHTFWQVIPMSFIVDWIFDVSTFLKQFRKKWLPGDIIIHNMGYSVKVEELNVKWWEASFQESGNPERCWYSTASSHYMRTKVPIDDRYFNNIDMLKIDGDITERRIFYGGLIFEQKVHSLLKKM
jgi:hypothetical protein